MKVLHDHSAGSALRDDDSTILGPLSSAEQDASSDPSTSSPASLTALAMGLTGGGSLVASRSTSGLDHGIITMEAAPTVGTPTDLVFQDATVTRDAAQGVLAGASDPDGDTLTVSDVSGNPVGVEFQVAFGHFTLYADGSYTYTADGDGTVALFDNDAEIDDTIGFQVSDGHGNTVDAQFTIVIDQTPKVDGVEAAVTSGADLSQPHSVALTYTFGKNIDAVADTVLHLSDGNTASYVSGSGTKVLTFAYDLTSPPALGVAVDSVTGGGFADTAGNPVPLADTDVGTSTLTVADTAANVVAFLDSQEAHSAEISAIHLTDGGALDVTQSQITADGDALRLIDEPYQLHVAGVSGTAPNTGASAPPPSYSSYDVYVDGAGVTQQTTYNNNDGTTTYVGGSTDVTVDDSASTHNDYFDMSATTSASLTGGTGNDGFYFGAALNGGDVVDGGGGAQDQIGLQGDYSSGVTLDGANVTNIEGLVLLAGYNYAIDTANLLSPGQTFIVQASHLASANWLDFDGSNETAGNFKVMGGAGDDTLKTGSGDDWLYGLGGADTLTGGAGTDRFVYTAVSDSTSNAHDTITDFDASTDKFDLPVSVTGIDPIIVSGAPLDSDGNFDSQLAAVTGSLHAHHAVLLEPLSGGLAGHVILVVDANGTAGYQAGQDFVFDVTGVAHPNSLSTSDFI